MKSELFIFTMGFLCFGSPRFRDPCSADWKEYVKGVINLSGKVIPVGGLRPK